MDGGLLATHVAAKMGLTHLLELICGIRAGPLGEATLHTQADDLSTPLHHSARWGQMIATQWLVQRSPRELWVKDDEGETPAENAQARDEAEVFVWLTKEKKRLEHACFVHLYRRKLKVNSSLSFSSGEATYSWVALFKWPSKDCDEAFEAKFSESKNMYICCSIGSLLNQDLEKYDECKARDCTQEQVKKKASECCTVKANQAFKLFLRDFDVQLPIDASNQRMKMDPIVRSCKILLYRRKIRNSASAYHWTLVFSWPNDESIPLENIPLENIPLEERYNCTYEGLQNPRTKKLCFNCYPSLPKEENGERWEIEDDYNANDCSPLKVYEAAKNIRVGGICIGDIETSLVDYKLLYQNCIIFARELAKEFGVTLPSSIVDCVSCLPIYSLDAVGEILQ